MRTLREIAVLTLTGAACTAFASPVEDGFSAYNIGDYAKALALWRPYAENGDPVAQTFLGDLYFAGQGVPQDFRQAQFWFKLAAAKGQIAAQYNLGVAAEQGKGVGKSVLQALGWYKKAADAGHVPSMLALARLHRHQEKPDLETAAHWTEKAAHTGDPAAQQELSLLYRVGSGVERNLSLSREWCRKAAEQGYAPAQNDLGVLYRSGAGGPHDDKLALDWLRRAADQGVAFANFNIATMYDSGIGTEKDPIEAYVWYSRTLAAHDARLRPRAETALKRLKLRMTPADIAKAEQRLSP